MFKKMIRFRPDKTTAAAFFIAAAIILLSVLMPLFSGSEIETVAHIILRDFLMIYVTGFCVPLSYVRRNEPEKYAVLGITRHKLKISLILNMLLAAGLTAQFAFGSETTILLNAETLFAVVYIFAAGIFEMVCIYGFIRHYLERAFGIIPAILLTAAIYSFHHAGFQPEFSELFFVGLMYCTVFYFTGNIFVIFPFFWGVGAVWDVLADSPAGQALRNSTTFFVALALLLAMLLFVRFRRKAKTEHDAGPLPSSE